MSRRYLVIGAATAAACLASVSGAYAAFPGANGKIAYTKASTAYEIHVMNQDGFGDVSLGSGHDPNWARDGIRIAFADSGGLWVMNGDGSGRHQIVGANADGTVSHPTWSPNGAHLAFAREKCVTDPQEFCTSKLETVNWDGTGETVIQSSQNPNPLEPNWSPDGSKIVFTGRVYANNFSPGDIYTINPDGTGESNLTNTASFEESAPDWSPDGQKILAWGEQQNALFAMNANGTNQISIRSGSGLGGVFSPDGAKIAFHDTNPPGGGVGVDAREIWTMNADGTDATRITNDPSGSYNFQPSWQPVATGRGFARPKGATPFRTYFTVAYKPCTSPNEQHGAPLAVLSCSPPQQASDYLTVGTLDANGQPANSVGSLRFDVKQGNPATPANEADVKIDFSEKDIRNKSDLSDYTGDLAPLATWRITGKWNFPIGGSPGSDPGTATEFTFPFPPEGVTCMATPADTTVGSTCTLTTTINTFVPGAVVEGKRENVQLGQVQVNDGGADGDASTRDDNTLFLTQGIFVP